MLVWTAKTKLSENAYVTTAILSLSQSLRFHYKNAVFKFIRLSVYGRPIRRKSYVFKFIWLSVDIALDKNLSF